MNNIDKIFSKLKCEERYILKGQKFIPLRVECLVGKEIDLSYSIKRNLLLSRRSAKSNNLNRRSQMVVKESNRIKEFRQLRKEIRGSKEHLIIGIDVAKNKHRAFFGTATGKTLLKRLVKVL